MIKEWLVGPHRAHRSAVPRDWVGLASEVPGIVVRPYGPNVILQEPRISAEVLGDDLAIARLQAVLGPMFGIQPLDAGSRQDW